MKPCIRSYPLLYRGPRKNRIARNYQRQYQSLKGAIYQHLSNRHDFQHGIDSTLIEQAARLFADWLYLEELLSSDDGKNAWKCADALVKIHNMLIESLDALAVTPKMRSKIVQEIVKDDDITAQLKKLTGIK